MPSPLTLLKGFSSGRCEIHEDIRSSTRAPSGSNRQPFRFVVLRDGPKAVEAAPVPEAPTVKDQVAADTALRTVVIDPGHGGRDPGAQGQSGTLEKAVTLAAAEELAALLKARGRYKVVLTRESDTTIRPDQREALARGAGADLFISLHADAIEESSVRGASG